MPRALTADQKEALKAAKIIRDGLLQDDFPTAHGFGSLYSLLTLLSWSRGAGSAIEPGLHGPLCQFLQATPYEKNLILIPRGYLKTSVITVAQTILQILRNPQIRILIASNKAENAQAMLADIKGHLTNPRLIQAFPDILWEDPARQAPKWTENVITVKRRRHTREGTVETIGISGEIVSKHYDDVKYDDVVGKENSATRDELLKTIQFIRLTQPLIDPGGRQWYIGTPWHYADAYAWLLEQQKTQGLALGTYILDCWEPAQEGEPGAEWAEGFGWKRSRYPKRFTVSTRVPGKKCLMDERRVMGFAEFAAQMLIDPVSADTVYFPRQKLQVKPTRDLPSLDTCWLVMTVDPAISTKAWADYSAIGGIAFDPAGSMVIPDLQRGRWKEDELVARCYDMYDRLTYAKGRVIAVGFEAIAFAKIYRRLFEQEGERRGYYLPVVTLERDTKITKNVRIRALQPMWNAGEITVASEASACEDLIEEAERWRPDRENTHDDLLDCVVDGLQLRAQPGATEQAESSLYDDPELIERSQFEAELLRKRPHLDHSSLRAAWSHEQRKRSFAQAQELAEVASEWAG
ncbi:MAG TPA: hypothetical protein VJ816_11400 [Gemmatimonadales bacterium]|nr:hypothetical protein [Gemmatimonadales bacterium]